MSKWTASFVVALIVVSRLLSSDLAVAQPAVRLGVEFQVNTHTPSFQRFPSIAGRTGGDFVVVWHSYGQVGIDTNIFARRFDSTGAPQAAEFEIDAFTTRSGRYPGIAMATDGTFMVAWDAADGSDRGLFARRFDPSGVALASEFLVNSIVLHNQRNAALAALGAGTFIVSWESDSPDGSGYGIFVRRYDSAGAAQATELQINAYTTGNQHHSALATQSGGGFIVVWQSLGQDGSQYGVFARRFDSSGVAQADELQVNSFTSANQRYPSVATASDGRFIVAWQSTGQDGDVEGVFARRFDSSGVPQAAEFQASTHTVTNQRNVAVASDSDGDFIVVWESSYQDGYGGGIFARRFDADGAPLAVEFQLNTRTIQQQGVPAVTMNDGGDFVVAWESYNQDGFKQGVFGQRFAARAILDVDADGATGALSDGLLVVRYMFGFTGATLTNGALGGQCKRCDAASLVTYLDGLGPVLDIDGSGQPLGPLTDGLLVLRFLFGFTGSTLTNGTGGGPCSRCDATTILPYLETLSEP